MLSRLILALKPNHRDASRPDRRNEYCKRRSDSDPSQALWDNASVGVTQRVTASGRLPATCTGVIVVTDYQLGGGAAAGYWKAVMMELDRRVPSKAADVIELMARICRHPVSARLADQKLARVEKVVTSWDSERVPAEPGTIRRKRFGASKAM
jgi:hypothetical protein